MDGINPTLAFAALLFGLHGNPQEATHQSAMSVQVEQPAGCAAVADVDDPVQLPRGADPIVRHAVPAASAGTAPDDPCKPER
jgi:hypothetical protein